MALKETLDTELCCEKITQDKNAIVLNFIAQHFYQQVMDSGNEMETFVPPFKSFPTAIATIIGIKTKDDMGFRTIAFHHGLLLELFAHYSQILQKHLLLCNILSVAFQPLLGTQNTKPCFAKITIFSLAAIPISGMTYIIWI